MDKEVNIDISVTKDDWTEADLPADESVSKETVTEKSLNENPLDKIDFGGFDHLPSLEQMSKNREKRERRDRFKRVALSVGIPSAVVALIVAIIVIAISATPVLKFEENSDGGYTVVGMNKGVRNLVIPAEYKGKPVTRIARYAFDNNNKKMVRIITVVIPDTVTEIGGNAFEDCNIMQLAYVPDSVTVIGKNAFPIGVDIYCEAKSRPSGYYVGGLWAYGSDVHWGSSIEDFNEAYDARYD